MRAKRLALVAFLLGLASILALVDRSSCSGAVLEDAREVAAVIAMKMTARTDRMRRALIRPNIALRLFLEA